MLSIMKKTYIKMLRGWFDVLDQKQMFIVATAISGISLVACYVFKASYAGISGNNVFEMFYLMKTKLIMELIITVFATPSLWLLAVSMLKVYVNFRDKVDDNLLLKIAYIALSILIYLILLIKAMEVYPIAGMMLFIITGASLKWYSEGEI